MNRVMNRVLYVFEGRLNWGPKEWARMGEGRWHGLGLWRRHFVQYERFDGMETRIVDCLKGKATLELVLEYDGMAAPRHRVFTLVARDPRGGKRRVLDTGKWLYGSAYFWWIGLFPTHQVRGIRLKGERLGPITLYGVPENIPFPLVEGGCSCKNCGAHRRETRERPRARRVA